MVLQEFWAYGRFLSILIYCDELVLDFFLVTAAGWTFLIFLDQFTKMPPNSWRELTHYVWLNHFKWFENFLFLYLLYSDSLLASYIFPIQPEPHSVNYCVLNQVFLLQLLRFLYHILHYYNSHVHIYQSFQFKCYAAARKNAFQGSLQ